MTSQSVPRKPNFKLRNARQAMRLSQSQFADAIRAAGNAVGDPNRCTKRLVQKWETGEHTKCTLPYLRVLMIMTGLPASELGFPVPDGSDVEDASSDEMVGAAAIAARPPIHRPWDDTMDKSLDRLHLAVENPSLVDTHTAQLLEVGTGVLFDFERHIPHRLLAPTVDRHFATATALLAASRHENVRRAVIISCGATALLASWMAFDRRDIGVTFRFWEAAKGVAEATAHEDLFTGCLIFQSYVAAWRTDPATAWQIAHHASVRTPHDPRLTVWATARSALHAAASGERKAAEAGIERSLEIGLDLQNSSPEDCGAPWTRSFDRARLLSSTALSMALMKSPAASDYAAQAVEALGTAKVKSTAIVLAEVALTAAILGDLKLCLEHGSAAATLTRDLGVSIAGDVLQEIIPVILPYSDTRPARELLPQLTRITRPRDREFEAQQEPDGETEDDIEIEVEVEDIEPE
ncbi:MAG TPA: hypothetical protein VL551_04140 [Actinospica sp.]|nr:hypothetical protein [Actinospica sp.]